jgi:hypothetical protein
MNQFSQAPEYPIMAISNFSENSQRLAAQGAPSVCLTPVANGKNPQSEKF